MLKFLHGIKKDFPGVRVRVQFPSKRLELPVLQRRPLPTYPACQVVNMAGEADQIWTEQFLHGIKKDFLGVRVRVQFLSKRF